MKQYLIKPIYALLLIIIFGNSFSMQLYAQCNCKEKDVVETEQVEQKKKILECLTEENLNNLKEPIETALSTKFPPRGKGVLAVLKKMVQDHCSKISGGDKDFENSLIQRIDKEYNVKAENFTSLKYALVCAAVKKRLTPATSVVADTTTKKATVLGDTLIRKIDLKALKDKNAGMAKEAALFQNLFLGCLLLLLGFASYLAYLLLNKPKQTTNAPPPPIFENFERHFMQQLSDKYITREVHAQKIQQEKDKYKEWFLQSSTSDKQEERKQEKQIAATGPVIPKIRLFAATPTGKTFDRTNEVFQAYESYFMIEYAPGANEGKIYLVDDPATRSHAFSMTDNLRGACELKGIGRPGANQKINEIPGQVEKIGDYWTIVKPIILDW
jgi:hypothetical protein